MLSKRFLIGFVALAIGIASAATDYSLDLTQTVQVGGTDLKPGKYKVEVQDGKAVFKSGKNVVAQAAATVENGSQKYSVTALSASGTKLQSIAIGGTTVKIVLAP